MCKGQKTISKGRRKMYRIADKFERMTKKLAKASRSDSVVKYTKRLLKAGDFISKHENYLSSPKFRKLLNKDARSLAKDLL